jgi:hypothetical protein
LGRRHPNPAGSGTGTALSYAGRSTTAALNVQEVVGDPMSDDPADIYITRDAFDQGELRGRLVCAIYVNGPDFVEITVHPADGGRFFEEPEPSAPEPSDGISANDAVDVARDALPEAEDWEVLVVEAGGAYSWCAATGGGRRDRLRRWVGVRRARVHRGLRRKRAVRFLPAIANPGGVPLAGRRQHAGMAV